MESYCLMGTEFLFGMTIKQVLEIVVMVTHVVNVNLMPPNCTVKKG